MKKDSRIPLLLTAALVLVFQMATGQNGTPRYTVPAAGGNGNVYAYVDAYLQAATCKNSLEYQPPGFDFNDKNTKYPLIIFFPGVNSTVQQDDYKNPAFGTPSYYYVESPSLTNRAYTWPSIVKMAQVGIWVNILSERAIYDIPGPGNTLSSFIVVGVQCADVEGIDNYEKFVRGYIFQKYKDKIDPTRIYLTGLSLGGGKSMEFLADFNRAGLVAAVAPVATGTECPYTPQFIQTYVSPSVAPVWANCSDRTKYDQILANIIAKPDLGVYFHHNMYDRSRAPYKISREFFYDPLMVARPAKTGGYFDPTVFDPAVYDGHDAWSRAYYPYPSNWDYNGKIMFSWFLDHSSSNLNLLPILVRNLTATVEAGGDVSLSWITTLESNASQFEVERSLNGKDFAQIAVIKAKGNSNSEIKYAYRDVNVAGGEVYYRLKLVDKDGRFEYSPTRKVRFLNKGLQFSVNPNPVSSEMNFTATGRAPAAMQLLLQDQAGRTLKTFRITKRSEPTLTYRISVADLPSGTYFISVQGDDISHVSRILKL